MKQLYDTCNFTKSPDNVIEVPHKIFDFANKYNLNIYGDFFSAFCVSFVKNLNV